MEGAVSWGRRRPCTLGLTGFFLVWYGLQLAVFVFVSEDVARWWFYFDKPPNIVSPGLLLGPLSHDMYSLTHIGSNVSLLLVVGGFAEPYVGKDRILVTVLGLGYLSTYLANATAAIHQLWMVAGASGGILSLFSYAGLRMGRRSVAGIDEGLSWSGAGVETILGVALLVGIPVFLIHQTLWISQPHSGHILGLLLGCVYFVTEVGFYRFGGSAG